MFTLMSAISLIVLQISIFIMALLITKNYIKNNFYVRDAYLAVFLIVNIINIILYVSLGNQFLQIFFTLQTLLVFRFLSSYIKTASIKWIATLTSSFNLMFVLLTMMFRDYSAVLFYLWLDFLASCFFMIKNRSNITNVIFKLSFSATCFAIMYTYNNDILVKSFLLLQNVIILVFSIVRYNKLVKLEKRI